MTKVKNTGSLPWTTFDSKKIAVFFRFSDRRSSRYRLPGSPGRETTFILDSQASVIGSWPHELRRFNCQGAECWIRLRCEGISLHQTAIHEIVACLTSKIQLPISFIDLLAGDPDIVQSLSRGGVTEHLLKEQELSWIVPAHHHLMIGEGLSERVG